MSQFSKTDQRRITFLSLLSSAATILAQVERGEDNAYELASQWLATMEADGFFGSPRWSGPGADEARPTQQRSERSARPASNGRSSNSGSRGRDQARGNGQGMRDPDGPPTKPQVDFLLKLTDDYTREDIEDMSKKEVSELIEDLKA